MSKSGNDTELNRKKRICYSIWKDKELLKARESQFVFDTCKANHNHTRMRKGPIQGGWASTSKSTYNFGPPGKAAPASFKPTYTKANAAQAAKTKPIQILQPGLVHLPNIIDLETQVFKENNINLINYLINSELFSNGYMTKYLNLGQGTTKKGVGFINLMDLLLKYYSLFLSFLILSSSSSRLLLAPLLTFLPSPLPLLIFPPFGH